MRRALVTLCLLLALAPAAVAQRAKAAPRAYTFARIEGRELKLDFHASASESPTPVVIWIHGGAWRGGSRQHVPEPVRALAREGISVASIDYRLTSEAGRWGEAPVHWPAQRDDAKAAVRWLRAHADELNVDPGAFVAWGSSAGGHLATILGLTNDAPGTTGEVGEHLEVSSAVRLAINFSGPTDLLLMNQDVTHPPGSTIDHDALGSPESLVLGSQVHGRSLGQIREHAGDPEAPWPELLALAHDASPVHAVVSAHAAPLFIAHGHRDTLIAFAQAQRLHRRLQELELPSTLRPVEAAGHGFGPAIHQEAIQWMRTGLETRDPAPEGGAPTPDGGEVR